MNAADLSNLSILIVDDEIDVLHALADIFEGQHCRVTTASTGADARAAFHSQQFDVALLDVRLPDADGTDLLREIRESCDLTRCIMVTASPGAQDAIKALNDGASAYIQKPADVDAIKRTILRVVGNYLKSAEERRKLQDLDIVKNVGEAAMDLDLERMLGNVLARAVEGFNADAGVILQCDEANGPLLGYVQHNLTHGPITDYIVAPGQGFEGRVAMERRVIDVEDIPGADCGPPTFLQRAGVASAMGAPILTPRGILGVLVLAWKTAHAFTEQDRSLLGVLAQRVGLAFANARLYAAEDASTRRAEYLARVSQELNSQIVDMREVVDRVSRLATERLGDGCAIFLSVPGSNTLDGVGSYHRVRSKQRILEHHLMDNPVHVGEGIVGQAVIIEEVIVAHTDELRGAYPHRPYLADLGIISTLAVPLRARGDVFGVMSCSISESNTPHSAEQVALAREFADRAAVAIDNAILLHEAQDKRAELQALFALTSRVSSTLQETEVLESVLKGTAQLLGVPACCIATHQPGRQTMTINREMGMSHDVAQQMASAALRAWPDIMLASEGPFLVADLPHCDNPEVEGLATRLHFASLLSVALDVEGARDRVLLVLTRDRDGSLASKRQLLNTLGALASVAITNARSYKREFTIAERVQQWILSTEFGEPPEVPADGIEIATDYHAALLEARVGGDFYDIFPVDRSLLGIIIGDVSGKGLDAALQTQAAKHTLRAFALDCASPAQVLARTNDAICRMLPADVFITLFYALLNTETRVLTWANAGHDPALICHLDSSITQLESSGRALGLLSRADYMEFTTPLAAGDVLLMYTDGVTEARNDGVFLETSGVAEILCRNAHLSAREVVDHVYSEVREYASGNLHDDIALLAVKVMDTSGIAILSPALC